MCYTSVMSDDPKEAGESPMARALRLKKAALEARPKAPGGKPLRGATGPAAGASKPWMKK